MLAEVVAYSARNLLASLPAQTMITYDAPADAQKPELYVLAVGVNAYHDEGWMPPGGAKREYFPPLKLAVDDAKSIGDALKEAGSGFYEQVIVRTAFDQEATAEGLERIVKEISAQVSPRDTFVLFAAAHGYSNNGRFYLLRKTIMAEQILRRWRAALSVRSIYRTGSPIASKREGASSCSTRASPAR
jgi:uncharacterized caspase-like protein